MHAKFSETILNNAYRKMPQLFYKKYTQHALQNAAVLLQNDR